MQNQDLKDALDLLFRKKISFIKTSIPAAIVSISERLVTVKPLIKTKLSLDASATTAEQDFITVTVPVCFPRSADGSSYITLPLKVGDEGILIYSMRDTYNFLRSKTGKPTDSGVFDGCGSDSTHPGLAFFPTGLSLKTEKLPIEQDRVQIVNNLSHVRMKPDGGVTIGNSTSAVAMSGSGDINISTNGCKINISGEDGSISLETSSDVNVSAQEVTATCNDFNISASSSFNVSSASANINGVQIQGGGVTASTSVAAPSVAAGMASGLTMGGVSVKESMDEHEEKYKNHTHEFDGETSGGSHYHGTTDKPSE